MNKIEDKVLEAWNYLLGSGITERELCIATTLCGSTRETLDSVCFIVFGVRSVEDLRDVERELR